MRGIILAAGKGSRLYPMTCALSKTLLPVYDKPMIYYPLAILLQAGIREILIIIPRGEEGSFYRLLGSGERFGVKILYAVQETPRGIADALMIGENFVGKDNVCLVLGDNIFYSPDISDYMKRAMANKIGASIFGYYVEDPRAFGVVELDAKGKALSLEEKPQKPKSHYAVPGLYFYDNTVMEIVRGLKPSDRGELEITDVNKEYLLRGELSVITFERQLMWLDAGTAEGLLTAAKKIETLQKQTGRYVACLEEISYLNGYISEQQLRRCAKNLGSTLYGEYLQRLLANVP